MTDLDKEDQGGNGVADLPNLGHASAEMLRTAGIVTIGELRDLGPVVAYLAVRQAGHHPSLNLLWAIAAGLDGRHWTDLSKAEKDVMLAELQDLTR